MYNFILALHSLLRWIILILLFINIVRHYWELNRPFTATDKKLGLWLMISAHITLLIGIYLWFAGSFGFQLIENFGMSAVMKDDTMRFWVVEHMTGMLIAIALITIGKGVAKKNLPDPVKHKRTLWFFLIALIIILVSVPWPFRVPGVGRPMLPGMN